MRGDGTIAISDEAKLLRQLLCAQKKAAYQQDAVQLARGLRDRRKAVEVSEGYAATAADLADKAAQANALEVIAHQLIDAEVEKWASPLRNRLRYPIPQLPTGEIADQIIKLRRRPAAEVLGLSSRDQRTLDDIAGFGDLLSGSRAATQYRVAAAELEACRSNLQAIANDQEMYQRAAGHGMILQHARSGLRAHFTVDGDGFGDVHSKPYGAGGVPSIGDSPSDWTTYVGFGIGTRIYRQGAALYPDVRWRAVVTSMYSAGVRRKLHALDPWRWHDSGCPWCNERGEWAMLSQADWAAHPPAAEAVS